jgi:hypothetical protein
MPWLGEEKGKDLGFTALLGLANSANKRDNGKGLQEDT